MSMARKMKRAAAKEQPSAELQGFDLTKVEATDIESIALDTEDHTITVSFSVPVNLGESQADYEETFEVEEDQRIGSAATALVKAIVDEVRKRSRNIQESTESICMTCTSKCCGRDFESVRVTQKDVERMRAADIDVSEKTIKYYSHELFSGHVGEFLLVPYTGPLATEGETCCPHLRRTGCSIYRQRPKICREFSSYTCGIYQEDPDKIDGKIRLEVVD